MPRKKLKKRKVTGRYKHATCHYCAEFYHSKIRQTSGEFVTRHSKGKKIRVKGNIIHRFCPAVRSFTTLDEPICSDENFSLTPMFYCEKRNCWLATNLTCYASRARKLEGCLRCRQFDQIISKITDVPEEDFSKRPSALSKPDTPARNPLRPIQSPQRKMPKIRLKRRRKSKPITTSIDRRRSTKKPSRLKRRRK